ncbi:hypothetical protein CEP50_05145 [Actinopolyspora mortivallis]|uniref:DUF3558 domain-containing protein n=1 Tax=Actinopolyspora mortivallis TaxID=33906 RepID=A0A2T0GZA9_ACTMO|nr:hypothetical protein CEP50_05145 [Actinopolyspora mortivallis]
MAGCATSTPADTNPDTTHTTTSSSEDPFAIPQPLNLAAITNPCHLLTQQQTTTLNAGPPQPGNKSAWGQKTCEWNNEKFNIRSAPDTKQKEGIKYAAFTNTEDGKPTHYIEGYPAVHSFPGELSCATFVGTSKTDVVSASFTVNTDGRENPQYQKPCDMSDKIAKMMLENIPSP